MRTILVSAYGCEPLKGSEAGVGWSWVLQMAKTNRLHVITRANNRELIEAHLPAECQANVTFHYYDAPDCIRNLKNKAKGLYFYYFCWQVGIISLVKKILQEHEIDYTMHLSFGSMWMPTFLPLFNRPFIWGPIGGADCEPITFIRTLPFRQRLIQYARYLMNATSFLNPMVALTAARAKVILCRTGNTAEAMPFFSRHKTKLVLETAMESSIFQHQQREMGDGCIRLLTSGKLMPSKNILTAVRALALLPERINYSYRIYGSGPQRGQIEAEVKRLHLQDRVSIIEELPRRELLREMEQGDIFLFPSLREGGSWSLMEAMAIGLPVICLDWAGMAISTDDASAIRLPVTNPEQMPRDMAKAIVTLAVDAGLRRRMGDAGRKRIRDVFNWESKGKFMEMLFAGLEEDQ